MTQIAEHRISRAEEYVKEAEILHKNKIGNLPILANLYHSMMNCLFALFNLEDPGNILHADLIDRFKIEFVQIGIFDKKYSNALDFAFNITHECNCEHMKPPEDEEIDKLFPVARELIKALTQYLN